LEIIIDFRFQPGMNYSQTKALAFAVQAHQKQTRKNGDPYVVHPIRVMYNLRQFLPENVRAGAPWAEVALLHDVVEDTDATEAQLREKFGDRIAGAVMEVTDDQTLSKGERKRAQLRSAPHKSRVARWVKMADMLDNLQDRLGHPEAFSAEANAGYFAWKYAIFRAFARDADESELVDQLSGVFDTAKRRGLWTETDAEPAALERYFAAEDAKV